MKCFVICSVLLTLACLEAAASGNDNDCGLVCGLKPASITAGESSVCCKICDFPCLGLSICMAPMIDSRHERCGEHKHHDHKHDHPSHDDHHHSHDDPDKHGGMGSAFARFR